MALIDDLRRQAAEEARLVDRITARFADELDSVILRLNRHIRQILNTLRTKDGHLIAERGDLGRALALRTELLAAIEAAGYRRLVTEAFDLDELAATTLRGNSIAARAARNTPIDPSVVTSLQDIRSRDLLQLGEGVAEAVWRATLDGVIGSRRLADLVDELAEMTYLSTRQARTLYDTSVSTYTRQVRQMGLPGEPGDRFVYLGPDDLKTRPFCQNIVGEVHTRAEIGQMSNGQLPNVLLTGGGYNCRHTWQFLGDATLEELGGTSRPRAQALDLDGTAPAPAAADPWDIPDDAMREERPGRGPGPVTLTVDEALALRQYTGSHYAALNKKSRTGEAFTPDEAERALNLDAAIAKAGEFAEPVTVWRGVGHGLSPDDFSPGATVTLDGYQSTSFRPTQAVAFGGSTDVGLLFEIRAKRGLYVPDALPGGVLFDDIRARTNAERELILPRNGRYRVRKVIPAQVEARSEFFGAKPTNVTVVQLEQ